MKTCLKPIWFVANVDLSIFIYFYVYEFHGGWGGGVGVVVLGDFFEFCMYLQTGFL